MTEVQTPGKGAPVPGPTVEQYITLSQANDNKLEKLKFVQSNLRIIVAAIDHSMSVLSELPEPGIATLIGEIKKAVLDVSDSTTDLELCERDRHKIHDPYLRSLADNLTSMRGYRDVLLERLAMVNNTVQSGMSKEDYIARTIVDIVDGTKDRKE